jgi:hypothetical protein
MTITKNIKEDLGIKLDPRTSLEARKSRVARMINTSRYEIVALQGNTVRLRPRYHNMRDEEGRFTRNRKRR